MHSFRLIRAVALSAPLLMLTACGGGDPAIMSMTVTPSTAAPGDQLTITIALENFDLVNPDDRGGGHGLRAAEEGHEEAVGDYPSEGHFHIYMDTVEENPLLLNCPGHCKHTGFATTVTSTVPNMAAAGTHKLILRLNNNTHMPLAPHIMSTADITVQ